MTLKITPIAAGARVQVGSFSAYVQPDLFRDLPDEAARKMLFAQSVRNVTLELSSYCNRRCRFCPNTQGSRLKAERLLPEETFRKIVHDLASIQYRRKIYFHLYNEPLAAPEILLERMSYARRFLRRAHFSLNTNGDYLSPSLLERLDAAGCNSIYVSIYGPDHGRWDDAYIKDRVEKTADSLGVAGSKIEEPGSDYSVIGKVGNVDIRVGGRNLWKSGYDRGAMIPELAVERSSPCLSPVTEVIVDHRGYSLPCCNVYTDNPDHIRYTTGNLNESDIFTVYAGQASRRWREGVLKFNPKGKLCEGCSRGDYPSLATEENEEAIGALRATLGIEKPPATAVVATSGQSVPAEA